LYDPQTLLREIASAVEVTAKAKGLAIELDLEPGSHSTLMGDSTVVREIVLALVWNAISFSTSGRVCILMRYFTETHWQVRVVNTGPHIPSAAAERIYEPFWRGGVVGSPVPTPGCGLGLAVARAFAHLTNSKLFLESSSASETTFCLEVPITSN